MLKGILGVGVGGGGRVGKLQREGYLKMYVSKGMYATIFVMDSSLNTVN